MREEAMNVFHRGQETKQQEREHRQKIEQYLQKMHRSPEHLQAYQILQGGVSGATTYRLQLTSEELILKVTHMESERSVRERAQRELSCYQTLLPCLPLHTPQVVAHERSAEAIVLLLRTYEPSAPPSEWQQWQYLEVAEQLAQLHASFWQNTEALAQFPWLRSHPWTLSSQHLQHARQQWQHFADNPHFQPLIPQSRFRWLMSLLPLLEDLESLLTSFPLTVCHGDCHIDNLLRDEQRQLIWADWQEAGVGLGPADLSFFSQRAFRSGGTVPFDAMIAAYHRKLEVETRKSLSLSLLHQVIDVFELQAWLLVWPAYLMGVSAQWLALLLNRIELLASRLHLVAPCP